MKQFAEFIRKNYQTIILITVVVGLLLGLWTAAPGKVVQRYSQALTFLMILFISLTITPRQFALVVRQPLAVVAGLVLNFVYMPLLCWALAHLLVSDPQLITGIILVGVVPCAGMAAVWTALLKGDVPLGMAINGLTIPYDCEMVIAKEGVEKLPTLDFDEADVERIAEKIAKEALGS